MSGPLPLKQQASRGAFWAFVCNLSVSAVSFGGTVVLSRILEPRDFGLLSMACLVMGVVSLFGNLGLGTALVQKGDITQEDLSTVFWANCAIGLSLAGLCVLVAPMAGMFFHEDAVKWILICLSANFIITAISSTNSMLMYKDVQMKTLGLIGVSARVLRVGVILTAAVCGLKAWSIVIGMIVECLFRTFVIMGRCSWRPSRVFSVPRFRELFGFGKHLFGSDALGYFNANMDFIVTGRVLGSHILGSYQMAYNLPNLLQMYINDSVGAVAFPVFSKVQDDNTRLAGGYLKSVKLIAAGAFPILFGLSFVARDFILFVYGEKWVLAVQPMQILCCSAALACVNTVSKPLLNAKGRPDIGFRWGCVRLPVTVVGILIGVHFGGVVGVAWGMLAAEMLSLVLVYEALKIVQCEFLNFIKVLVPAAIASGIMIGMLTMVCHIFPCNGLSVWMRLAFECAVGALVYGTVFVFGFRNVLNELVRTVRYVK